MIRVGCSGWSYLRFHAGRRGRRGRYSTSELVGWGGRIRDARGDVLAYFNNDWEGFAVENARSLLSILDGDPVG